MQSVSDPGTAGTDDAHTHTGVSVLTEPWCIYRWYNR